MCINKYNTAVNTNKVLPLADDLSIGFNQIIRHVSASQVLQSVCVADLHLDQKKKKIKLFKYHMLGKFKFIGVGFSFMALTCGGGRPPAPAGHSGSIRFRFPQLHSHSGEGFSMVQLPLSKMSRTV